ncbi:hypothetical protein B566_EDAN016929 [Ephemera danica]|nr:hypothetical protein B566_EDAN016929 [Ephemera danica]
MSTVTCHVLILWLLGVWLVPVGVVLPINSAEAAAVVATRGCTVRFVSQVSCSAMNNYQQQQQQQQQSPALPPSLHATSQVSGYQQYGSSATAMGTMGGNNLGTNTDGMVAYPTAHLYQQANSRCNEAYFTYVLTGKTLTVTIRIFVAWVRLKWCHRPSLRLLEFLILSPRLS